MPDQSRRTFLRIAAAAAAASSLPRSLRAVTPAAPAIRLGYAAITWQGKDDQAIDDISSLGFHGIQLRAAAVERWGAKPEELRGLLQKKGLALLCLSSGDVDADPAQRSKYVDLHAQHARFVKAVGGDVLQVISERPKDHAPTPAEFERLGQLLNEIGRLTSDLGVRLVYHNHMNGFGEAPDEVARLLDASDRRFVSLLLDIAHYKQGGGDPVAAVTRHKDRIAVLHLKDVKGPLPGDTRPARESYEFVELGRGTVDVPGVVKALRAISFSGPAIIELDKVPGGARSPKEAAADNKRYAVETLGLNP